MKLLKGNVDFFGWVLQIFGKDRPCLRSGGIVADHSSGGSELVIAIQAELCGRYSHPRAPLEVGSLVYRSTSVFAFD